jgi:hypothetical protein
MREITDHKVNGLNEALQIEVLDEPGAGGACHQYRITLVNPNSSLNRIWEIDFQNGLILEAGFNGISGEALMAIQIDRLRSFQAGPFACRDNAIALTHLETALIWLQKRTRDRIARGVEGKTER